MRFSHGVPSALMLSAAYTGTLGTASCTTCEYRRLMAMRDHPENPALQSIASNQTSVMPGEYCRTNCLSSGFREWAEAAGRMQERKQYAVASDRHHPILDMTLVPTSKSFIQPGYRLMIPAFPLPVTGRIRIGLLQIRPGCIHHWHLHRRF